MSNFQTIDQEIIGGAVNGTLWGDSKGCRVLARTQDRLVLWASGGTTKSGICTYYWHPAKMVIVSRREQAWRDGTYAKICHGERLHNRVFAKFAEKIDSVMGEGFHTLLDIHKTVVVGDNPPFSKYGHEMPVSKEWKAAMDRVAAERLVIEPDYI